MFSYVDNVAENLLPVNFAICRNTSLPLKLGTISQKIRLQYSSLFKFHRSQIFRVDVVNSVKVGIFSGLVVLDMSPHYQMLLIAMFNLFIQKYLTL